MIVLIVFAFLAGIVTILSPCILPVLPIILSSSVSGGKKKPLGVITGFVASFTFFTLFLSALVKATGIPADSLRLISVVVIFLFGLALVLPQFQLWVEKLFAKLSSLVPNNSRKNGFSGGLLVGVSLGLIWTPCVGPILAAVISLAVAGSVTSSALLITLAYALGTALPMLLILYGGQQLLKKVPWLLRNSARIQKGFGVLMMITAVTIFLNWDRKFQTWVLTTFPSYGTGLTQIEQNGLVDQQLNQLRQGGSSVLEQTQDTLSKSLGLKSPVPELNGGTHWINSEALTFANQLKGKVVLIDFWTYSCINCIRTLPYITKWYDKYKDQGLVVIGVHSPEFAFEKVTSNVEAATKDFHINYPVIQDNDFKIWTAFSNHYWPAHYLVDKQGNIRYTHFGEGAYTETENQIRELLGESPLPDTETDKPARHQSAETYLGSSRADAYVSTQYVVPNQTKTYTFASNLPNEAVALAGTWLVEPERIIAHNNAALRFNFMAQQVYLVMSNESKDGVVPAVSVLLDGQPLPQKYWTNDTDTQGKIQVTAAKKYDILDLGADYGRHVLELRFDPGAAAYAFTFGS